MTKSRVDLKSNSFDRWAEHTKSFGAQLVEETANAIEAAVKAEWAWTQLPIRTETSGQGRKMLATIVAGKRARFYAGFLEFGTQSISPKPAMTPAAEHERASFMAKAMTLERGFRE